MTLTDVEKVRLEIGLSGQAADILSDAEIQYFLDKNNYSVKKASLDAAKTVLFILAQLVHERSGSELEIWNHTWFENYMKVLQLYITNPNFSVALEQAKVYAGGISATDIRNNVENSDNFTVQVDVGIPKDYDAINSTNTKQDIFNPDSMGYSTSPFNV